MDRRVGLVLSGGGGKGSYQIGVLKALREYGWEERISAISGTSVGALNTGLFLQRDLELAEEIWLSISPSQILLLQADHLIHQLILSGIIRSTPPLVLYWARRLAQHGVFSREGMLDILYNQLDLSLISEARIPAYATCFDLFSSGAEYFSLNRRPPEEIASILLASSAIPLLFGTVEIDGREYVDGGLRDNVPIQPLYRIGCDVIIVLYLDRSQEIPRDLYPNCTLLPIVPQKDQGGILSGTLDFNPEAVKRRIAQGYEDTILLLSPYQKLLETERRRSILLEGLIEENRQVERDGEEIDKGDSYKRISKDKEVLPSEDLPMIGERLDIFSTLTQNERKRVETGIKDYLHTYRDKSQGLLDIALDAVGYLAPLKGRSLALKEQGLFKRFFYTIMGKNLSLSAENQRDLALSQYATLSLINQLYEEGLMTLEVLTYLQEKTQYLLLEISSTEEVLTELSLSIYGTLSQLLHKMREEMDREKKRVTLLSQQKKIHTWLREIHYQTYKSRPYPQLKDEEIFVCLVNDFFILTKGDFRAGDLLSLREAFYRLSLLEERVHPQIFLLEMIDQRILKRRLLRGLRRGRPLEDLLLLKNHRDEREGDGRKTTDVDITLYDLALEILYGLSDLGFTVDERIEDRAKTPLLSKLHGLEELTIRYSLEEERAVIHRLFRTIESHRILISFIDNNHLYHSLLSQFLHLEPIALDNSLTENIPTEYHLARDSIERQVLYFDNGSIREYPLSFSSRVLSPTHPIHHQKIYLDRSLLTHHPMILVSLPGNLFSGKRRESSLEYLEGAELHILSTKNHQTLKDLYKALGESFFYQKTYGLFFEEGDGGPIPEDGLYETIYKRALFITSICTCTEEEIRRGLLLLKEYREEMIQRIFEQQIEREVLYIERALKALKYPQDLSISALKEREESIKEKKREWRSILERERKRMREVIPSIRDKILHNVEEVLQRHREELISLLLSDSSIESRVEELIKTTFNQGIKEYALPLFLSMASRLSSHLSLRTEKTLYEKEEFSLVERESLELEEKIEEVSQSTLGLLLFGPIGFLLQGLFHSMTSRRREEELREELDSWIERVLRTISQEGEVYLQSLGEESILLLETRVKEELRRLHSLLDSQREKIEKTREGRERWEQQLEEDLLQVQEMVHQGCTSYFKRDSRRTHKS